MDALVQWDPGVPSSPDLVGYTVGHGYRPGEYDDFVTVLAPTQQYQFTGLDDFREHHFSVASFDTVPNQSAFGTNVSKRVAHRLTLK